MDEVIAALLAWTVAHSSYAPPASPPAVEYRPSSAFAAAVCPPENGHCTPRGYYEDGSGAIVLHEAYGDLADAGARALLVHEMVHYLQDLSGRWGAKTCATWLAREHEAYALQLFYLRSEGGSPLALRMPVLSTRLCPAE